MNPSKSDLCCIIQNFIATPSLGVLLRHHEQAKMFQAGLFKQFHYKTPGTGSPPTTLLLCTTICLINIYRNCDFFFFQVGMIQMATDKNNVKKKKQIKGCTQELMFIANKQTKRGEKTQRKE